MSRTISCMLSIALFASLGVSCRNGSRSWWGPEDLVLNSNAEIPALVEQTIVGVVSCPTCDPEGTSMLVDIWPQANPGTEPLATAMFARVGAYQITAKVPYGEPLTVTMKIFANGGVRDLSSDLIATTDTSQASHTMTLNVTTQ